MTTSPGGGPSTTLDGRKPFGRRRAYPRRANRHLFRHRICETILLALFYSGAVGAKERTMSLFVRLVLVLLGAIAAGCAAETLEPPTQEETAAIYAVVIRQIYTEDDTFGGTLQPPTLYILGTTDDRAGDPGSQAANPALIAAPVRESLITLLADLPTELIWVETREEVPLEADTGAVVDGGALITLGNVAPQSDGSLHVAASIYRASLAAGGQTYILEEIDGVWTITGNTGVEWIS
jgi:hypothetical protein